jgi:Right handed beta helix region
MAVSTCLSQDRRIGVSDTESLFSELARLRTLRTSGDLSPVVIEINVQVLQLNRTIELDEQTIGDGLTIRAGEGLPDACLTGAVDLKLASSDEVAWRFALPSNWNAFGVPRQLIVNSKLSAPARHPNVGTLRIEKTLPDRRSGFTVTQGSFPEAFSADANKADLVFLHDWSSSRLPIKTFDSQALTLTTVGPIGCEAKHYAIDHYESQPRFWVEGSPSLADAPGEWWIDRETGEVVMLKIPESEVPTVAFPLLETLLRVESQTAVPIKGFKLEKICFRGSRFPMPTGGLAEAQATMHEPRDGQGIRQTTNRPLLSAAVHFENVSSATISQCQFTGLCNTGLWLGSRSKDCVIEQCKFVNIGGNGINVGEDGSRTIDGKTWYQADPTQVPTNNRIARCEIQKTGQILPGSVAIWAAINLALTIEDNTISDIPYTGISLGWVWNDSETPAGQNTIRGNRIKHAMQLLSDGGGIYTLGRQPGTIIETNDISGIPHAAGRAESNGMFLDEGTTGLTIRDNTIRFVAQSPLRFHRAGKNVATKNSWELATETTPEIRYNSTPEANVESSDNVVLQRLPRVFLIGNSLTWDTIPAALDGEVYWHVDCGKNLPYIRKHPDAPCVESSTLWPYGLRLGPFDFVVFQPHYGSTLEQDAETIESWLVDQPDATLVIHTGWARQATLRDELAAGIDTMQHNANYFMALNERLTQNRPTLRIRTTNAFKMLAEIDRDIQSGAAPALQVSDFYRDAIHMSHELGRPMMHSMMRIALGQKIQFEPKASVDKAVADYVRERLEDAQKQSLTQD